MNWEAPSVLRRGSSLHLLLVNVTNIKKFLLPLLEKTYQPIARS
jgi:hypothetical protein